MSTGLPPVSSMITASNADQPLLKRTISSHNLGPSGPTIPVLPLFNLPPSAQSVPLTASRFVSISERPLEIDKRFSQMSLSNKDPVS